jgi:glycosyltransferase involved in cell wall biosynthesis
MSDPRVTVLTTVYNGARYLEEAVESIRADGFSDFEHVIVDDGSTDETPEIIARAAARDPRVVALRNETNRGIAAAANRGLAASRGEYVARLDSDDVSLPGRLGREVALLDERPDVALVSMNYETMTAEGVVYARSRRDYPTEVVEYLLNFSNSLGGHSQVMFRRGVVEELGGYDESCRAALDYDLWARIVGRGRIVVLPEVGMRYRVHHESLTASGRGRQFEVGMRVARRMLSTYLGRELSDREVLALAQAWRWDAGGEEGINPQLADAVLREAYAIFRRTNGLHHRLLVRRHVARQLTNASLLRLVRRDFADALHYLLQALRWHAPKAITYGASAVTKRLPGLARGVVRRVRRRLRPAKPEAYWESRRHMRYYRETVALVQRHCPDAASVLDVGARDTPVASWFSWIPARTAIDLDTQPRVPGATNIRGDFLAYAPEQPFDVVLCLQVLEHLDDPEPFVRRLFAVGRNVVISVPYHWPKGMVKEHVQDPVDERKLLCWTKRPWREHVIVTDDDYARLVAIFDGDELVAAASS